MLKNIKEKGNIWTKSGLMVGLGKISEIYNVMEDMRRVNVDFLTVGQYLQPSKGHQKLIKTIHLKNLNLLKKRPGN